MRAGPPPVHCVVAVMGGWGWGRDTYEYGWVAHALHATRNKRTCTVAANPSVASSRRCSWPTPDMTMAEVAGSTAASACCSDVNENGAAGGDGGASENDTGCRCCDSLTAQPSSPTCPPRCPGCSLCCKPPTSGCWPFLPGQRCSIQVAALNSLLEGQRWKTMAALTPLWAATLLAAACRYDDSWWRRVCNVAMLQAMNIITKQAPQSQ